MFEKILTLLPIAFSYYYIVWGIWLRHCLNGRQDEFEMTWPSIMFSFPRVERKHTSSNGVLKKAN